jgi:hypothetical protein
MNKMNKMNKMNNNLRSLRSDARFAKIEAACVSGSVVMSRGSDFVDLEAQMPVMGDDELEARLSAAVDSGFVSLRKGRKAWAALLRCQDQENIRGLKRAIHDGRIAMRRCHIVPSVTVRRKGLAWCFPSIEDEDNDTLVGCYNDGEEDVLFEDEEQ